MRKLIACVLLLLMSVPAWAAAPETEEQKALYALGVHMARQLSVFNLSAGEFEFVKDGMMDVAAGKKPLAEPEAYGQSINALAQSRMQAAAKKNKEAAALFLAKEAAVHGARKTASGLVYQELRAGTGTMPKASDTVKVHYVGTFIDGNEFDSSVRRGEPAEFPLGQVIPCWTEGVAMMKAGGKARLICPSDIAYGDEGRPPVIPGGAALVFEVELLDVKSPATPAESPKAAPKAGKKK